MDKKRIITFVLAASLAAGYLGGPIAYASDNQRVLSQNEKIEILQDKNILIGKKFNKDFSDSLSLGDKITRSEITKLVVYTIGREELARKLDGATKPFPDVELSYWANGFISAAATTDIQKGQYRLVIGNEDGMFMPDQEINYGELATMLLRAVKPNLNETGMIYPKDYVEAAEREGIFKGLSKVTVNKPVVRSEAFEMVYNAYSKLGTVPKTYTDNIGIVRRVSGWGLVANKTIKFDTDSSTEYRISDEFKKTDGGQWEVVKNKELNDVISYGILTKYVLDDKNQISHLIELGNEINGAMSKDRFNTLFKLAANGTVFETNDYEGSNSSDVKVYDSFKITNGGLGVELVSSNSTSNTQIELSDSTKVYILQGDKVYELKTENDKKNNLPDSNKINTNKNRVYGAYETEDGKNKGIVLVFSDKVVKSESQLIEDAKKALEDYKKNPTSITYRDVAANAIRKLSDGKVKDDLTSEFNKIYNAYKITEVTSSEIEQYDKAIKFINDYKSMRSNDNKEAALKEVNKLDKNSDLYKRAKNYYDYVVSEVSKYDTAFSLISDYGKETDQIKKKEAMEKARKAIDNVDDEYLRKLLEDEFNKVEKPAIEKTLEELKSELISNISKLENLTDADRGKLLKDINEATNKDELTALENKAKALDKRRLDEKGYKSDNNETQIESTIDLNKNGNFTQELKPNVFIEEPKKIEPRKDEDGKVIEKNIDIFTTSDYNTDANVEYFDKIFNDSNKTGSEYLDTLLNSIFGKKSQN